MSEHLDRFTLEAYVEQSLSALERRTVEAHVTACPRCQANLAAAKQMTALLYDLPREQPAPDLVARIIAAVAVRRIPAVSPWLRLLAPAAFAVGCGLLAVAWPQWSIWVQSWAVQLPPAEAMMAWWLGVLSDPALALEELGALLEPTLYTQDASVLFTLSMVLLALASVLGLAQLLGEQPQPVKRDLTQAWGRG